MCTLRAAGTRPVALAPDHVTRLDAYTNHDFDDNGVVCGVLALDVDL